MPVEIRTTTITLEAALRDLTSKNDRVRAAAAHALGDVSDGEDRPAAQEALVRALGDHRPEVRAAACLSLGDLGDGDAASPVSLCLDDGVSQVRQAAAIALGKLGHEDGFAPLARAIEDGPADVRFQAATSLVEIDADRAFEPLMAALSSEEDAEVLGALALALGTVGDRRAAESISALLDHKRIDTRFDAAYALAHLGDDRAVPELQSQSCDPQRGWDAVCALERLGAAAESALERPIGDKKVPGQIAVRAAGALLSIRPDGPAHERAQARLLQGLRDRRYEVRALTIEELAQVGGQWAIGPLSDLRRRWRGRKLADEIDACLTAIAERADEDTAR